MFISVFTYNALILVFSSVVCLSLVGWLTLLSWLAFITWLTSFQSKLLDTVDESSHSTSVTTMLQKHQSWQVLLQRTQPHLI